jgi:diguanylate cyclase (GGDEF)-like protein
MLRFPACASVGALLRCMAVFLAGLTALLAQPAVARTPEACLGMIASQADYPRLLASDQAWNCDRASWARADGLAVLRFVPEDGKVPARFTTRLSRIGSLRVGVIEPSGQLAWQALDRDALRTFGHMTMSIDLPMAGQPASAVLIEMSQISLAGTVTEARLHGREVEPGFHRDELYLALLCGLLLAPLLFNLAFYRILRERFLFWHAGVVVLMLVHVVVTSGLSRYLVSIPIAIVSYAVALTYSAGVASAIMLARSFIEPQLLTARMRLALLLSAVWIMVNVAILIVAIEFLDLPAARLYFIGWIPVVAVLVCALASAARNGSRAAWYQIAAWAPLILLGIGQILLNAAGYTEPRIVHQLKGAAIAWEVMLISLGIIDRLVNLRRDRDHHQRRASKLEQLAERDPLTGLMNRRAIEPHFARLREEGYATFAVIDLDRFKDINDRFGHAVGDRVLQAAARALAPSNDMLSMRLGGEEFVLLLRGSGAVRHAEWCRRALSNRIAAEVEGLDRLVTASMGLVEVPRDVMPDASFAAIYARADGLLYQAKRGGRNRTVKERLTSFARPVRKKNRGAAA